MQPQSLGLHPTSDEGEMLKSLGYILMRTLWSIHYHCQSWRSSQRDTIVVGIPFGKRHFLAFMVHFPTSPRERAMLQSRHGFPSTAANNEKKKSQYSYVYSDFFGGGAARKILFSGGSFSGQNETREALWVTQSFLLVSVARRVAVVFGVRPRGPRGPLHINDTQ